MTLHEAQQQLLTSLLTIYDNREAANITDWVLENITGWQKIDRVVNKQAHLLAEQQTRLEKISNDLLRHRPVQYALGEAWFYGLKFYVNESVLIPRPETEELVEWIISDVKKNLPKENFSILDVGTGSGCIPIALKKSLPDADVTSCDVSHDALAVARRNANDLNVNVQFHLVDFLSEKERSSLGKFDVIVSNPPYIPAREHEEMDKHVVDFEPHLALFVDNNEPLVFYKAIANFSQEHLSPGGMIYFETHMNLAEEVAELFRCNQFASVEVKQDLQGRNRMVKVVF